MRSELVGRLYDEYGASLFRYALMLLADHSAAEDAVQHVFAAVMRQRSIENPAHYLRRAVRNECYSMLRRRMSQPVLDRPLLEPITTEAVSADERIALERGIVALPPSPTAIPDTRGQRSARAGRAAVPTAGTSAAHAQPSSALSFSTA